MLTEEFRGVALLKCRHCGSELELCFLDLGSAPPSNAYLTAQALAAPEKMVSTACDGLRTLLVGANRGLLPNQRTVLTPTTRTSAAFQTAGLRMPNAMSPT